MLEKINTLEVRGGRGRENENTYNPIAVCIEYWHCLQLHNDGELQKDVTASRIDNEARSKLQA